MDNLTELKTLLDKMVAEMRENLAKTNATAKTNWQNSEYYEQDLAVLEQKGITIA